MLLDRIDIDSHGPLARVGLGPFSQQLNLIFAAAGSGKTALIRFLRDSLTGTTPAYDGMAQSSGRVVWAAADGLYHCRREPNGTTQGRRFVEFESRLGGQLGSHWNRPSVIVDLPASIVDGIVTDTTLTSVRRVVQSVIRSGLDQGIQAAAHGQRAEIAALKSEIARLRTLLHREGYTENTAPSEQQIRDRLAALTLELGAIDSRREFARQTAAAAERGRRDRDAIAQAVDEVDRLRDQETDLRKRINTLDQSLVRLEEQARRDENRTVLTQLTRTRVHWLNQQIERLRRLLGEVRGLGDDWFGGHLAAKDQHPQTPVERLSGAEIEARLDSICHLVDHLAGRLEAEQEQWTNVDHPAAEIACDVLTESERALERMSRTDAPGGRDRSSNQQHLHGDPGWIDDSLRRRRIDSLRRAQQRRRLDESIDCELVQGRAEDAFLITLRTIGTSLHCVSRSLRVLRAQQNLDAASWTESAWLRTDEFHDNAMAAQPHSERADTLHRCEQELVATLERLAQHRIGLLRRAAPAQQLPESLLEAMIADASVLPAAVDHWLETKLSPKSDDRSLLDDSCDESGDCQNDESMRHRLQHERRQLAGELERAIGQMNQKLAEAEGLRSRLRTLSTLPRRDDDSAQRARIEAEVQRLQRRLSEPAQSAALQRYRHCVLRLRTLEASQRTASPLAAAASSYLQRLSGGRLRTVAWQDFIDSPSGHQHVAVTIDSQPEARWSEVDRYLVALAIRMAAADELSRRGRPLPLVIETLTRLDASGNAFLPAADLPAAECLSFRSDERGGGVSAGMQNFVATLAELSDRGRQIILLTAERGLAEAVASVGGRSYALNRARFSTSLPVQDVNRHFDIQWRETYGIDDLPSDYAAAPPVHAAIDESDRSAFDRPVVDAVVRGAGEPRPQVNSDSRTLAADISEPTFRGVDTQPLGGGVIADHSETQPPDVVTFPTRHTSLRNGHGGAEKNAFFLTGDSPIEQSPSIDVLAAVRLRGLGIVYVSHLLMASPQELAQRMQMADINAATIRRWQNECRLVCGVAGLRGFDARVLVGCGIVHPREITEIQPAELVEKVEAFLATPRGVQILRTGTSHEVSRLTSWIAEARQSTRSGDTPSRKGATNESQSTRSAARQPDPAQAKAEPGSQDRDGRKGTSRTRVRRAAESLRPRRESTSRGDGVLASSSAKVAPTPGQADQKDLKFYLHRQSPIVDAPSIGPRMAQRLASLKIRSVDDLLQAKPSVIAAALKLRRVDESTVRGWQQQIKLVCRVPLLRGHDAQLLVAAGITEPERLAQCDPQWLLSQIDPISRSREGQNILRGGKQPDLAEISDWVRCAKQHRELRAA